MQLPEPSSFDQPASKRYCLVFGALCMLLLVSVWIGNYVIDPFGERADGMIPPVEQSSRYLKMRLLDNAPSDTELLILGSSRQLRVLPSEVSRLSGKPSFNAAVTSGGAQDALALTRYAIEDAGLPIDTIYWGLDVERFSPHQGLREDLVTNHALMKHLDHEHTDADTPMIGTTNITFDRSYQSATAAYRWIRGVTPPEHYRFRPDGSRENLRGEARIANGEHNLEAALAYDKQRYRDICANFDRLDEHAKAATRSLIEYCAEEDIELTIYFSASHPELLADLREHTAFFERLDEFKAWLKPIADQDHVRLFDFTQMTSFGGDPDAYYDGTHPFDSNTTKMFEAMLSEKAPLANR